MLTVPQSLLLAVLISVKPAVEGIVAVAQLLMVLPHEPDVPVIIKFTVLPIGKKGIVIPLPCKLATVKLAAVGPVAYPPCPGPTVSVILVTVKLLTAGSVSTTLVRSVRPVFITLTSNLTL